MSNVKELAQQIDALSLKEARALVEELQSLGYTLPTAVVAPQPAVEAKKEEKKSTFDVFLTKVSEDSGKRLKCVPLAKPLLKLDLKAAKEAITILPAKLAENVSMVEAEKIKADFEALEATIEIR